MARWSGHRTDYTPPPADADLPDVVLVALGDNVDHALALIAALSNREGGQKPTVIALHEGLDGEVILSAMRHGADEFVQFPKDSHSLITILNKDAQRRADLAQQVSQSTGAASEHTLGGQLIGVFSPKGGGGATLLATNLAQQLVAQQGKRVCLVDTHPQYNTIGHQLNCQFKHGLSDMAATGSSNDTIEASVLEKLCHPVNESLPGLDVLVCCKNPTDDTSPPSDALWESTLIGLKVRYDVVIVDLPSQVVDGVHQLVNRLADKVLLVYMMDLPSLSRTRQYLEIAQAYLTLDKIALVLNRYNLEAASNISYQKLEDAFHHPVFARLTNDWPLTVEATTLGHFLAEVKPSAPLVKDITRLAQILVAPEGLDAVVNDNGFLGKLKRLMPSNCGGQS